MRSDISKEIVYPDEFTGIYSDYGGYARVEFTKKGAYIILTAYEHELVDISREIMIVARKTSPSKEVTRHLPDIKRISVSKYGSRYQFKYLMPVYFPVTDLEYNFAINEIRDDNSSLGKTIKHILKTANLFGGIVRKDWKIDNMSSNWNVILRDPIVMLAKPKDLFDYCRSGRISVLKQKLTH